MSINRNKRSLTLNFKEDEAKEIFLKLSADADVIVENFTPGVMERFGLGYDVVSSVNSRIIYTSISGFGQDGPYRRLPAYDQIMQGVSGMMSLTGEPDGDPPEGGGLQFPTSGLGCGPPSLSWRRYTTGTEHGEGQYIDVSMLDGQVAWLTYQAATYFANGKPPARLGAAHPNLCPYQAFMCQDGKFINVAVGSERIWERFREAMKLEELDKPDYATNGDRVNNRSVLVPYLQQVFLTRPVAEWVSDLQEVSVPCGAINDLADVFADPQIEARDMLQEMVHPVAGKIKQTGIPVKFSRTPGGLDMPPPLLGQHNGEILKELGYSESEIESLVKRDVI